MEAAARTFRLDTLTAEDVAECSDAIRGIGRGFQTMEEVAQEITRYLYEHLVDADGKPACALVRLYKTHAFGELPPDVADFVRAASDPEPDADARCLTLLGTAGDLPEWNSRHASVGHKAIPLLSAQMVERLPMVHRLITQLGVDVEAILHADPDAARVHANRIYDVFHVSEAEGSPVLPAQDDFVVPHRIRSAVGFGGILYSGDFYAVVMFSKVPVDATVARRLKLLALPIRLPLLRFVVAETFTPAAAA